MRYLEIRNELNTGDIVLFSGRDPISTVIKWATRSKWSHVGMVIRSQELDMVLLWESMLIGAIKDVQSHTVKQGVQLVALSERIKSYSGIVGTRRLEDVDMTPDRIKDLAVFRAEIKDRPYEEDKIELMKSAYDGSFGNNEEDLSSLFCSEMVAEAYQRMGLLTDNTPSNEYTPADFSNYLNLEDGRLSEIIEVEV